MFFLSFFLSVYAKGRPVTVACRFTCELKLTQHDLPHKIRAHWHCLVEHEGSEQTSDSLQKVHFMASRMMLGFSWDLKDGWIPGFEVKVLHPTRVKPNRTAKK